MGDKRKQIRFEDEIEDTERRKSRRVIALEEKKRHQERERKIAEEIEKKKRQQERERKLAKEIEKKKNSVNPEVNNKGKGKATIEIGDDLSDFNEDEEGPTKKGHKNKELYQLISSIKGLGRHAYTASASGSNGSSSSGTPLKKILENIIDFLQRKDTNELFALPSNLDAVENYRDIVKQPMDFGTMRAKLHEAMYTNFDQFKRDVFLICSNAINTNPQTSTYHKAAEKISKYAKQIFEALKDDCQHFESEELPPNKTRPCKKLQNGKERRTSRRVSPKLAGRRNATETEKRYMYWPTNKPLVADVLCGNKPNIHLNEKQLDYKQSLLKFVENLGPTAKRVAEGKLKALQDQQLSNQENAVSGVQTIHQQTPQIPRLSDLFDTQKLVLAQPFFNRPHRNSGFATSLNRFVNTNVNRVNTSVPSSSKVLSIVHPTLVISGLQPRPEATINISNRSLMPQSQTMQKHSVSMYDKPVNIRTGKMLMQQHQRQPWPAESASHQNPLRPHFSQQNQRESIPGTSYQAGNVEVMGDVQHFNNNNCLMQASYGKGGGLHQAAPKIHGFPNKEMQVNSQMKPLGDGPVPLQEPNSSSSLPMALGGVINHCAEEAPPQLPCGDDQQPNLNLRL